MKNLRTLCENVEAAGLAYDMARNIGDFAPQGTDLSKAAQELEDLLKDRLREFPSELRATTRVMATNILRELDEESSSTKLRLLHETDPVGTKVIWLRTDTRTPHPKVTESRIFQWIGSGWVLIDNTACLAKDVYVLVRD